MKRKSDLPQKTCPVCERPFSWRAKSSLWPTVAASCSSIEARSWLSCSQSPCLSVNWFSYRSRAAVTNLVRLLDLAEQGIKQLFVRQQQIIVSEGMA